jgi:hypothetical protein
MTPLKLVPQTAPSASNRRLVAYAQGVRKSLLGELEAIEAGEDLGKGRNDRLFKIVVRLANFIPAPWEAWTETQIRSDVTPLAIARAIPNALPTIDSAIAKGRDNPASIPDDLKAAAAVAGGVLRNFEWVDGEGGKRRKERVAVGEIRQRIFEACDNWPRRLGERLFVPGDEGVRWLPDPTALTTWLDERFSVEFAGSAGVKLASAAEITASVYAHAQRYDTIERYPHTPPVEGAYYSPREDITPRGGRALAEFVSLLNPESEVDRALLEAALLTPGWGGPPGERPAFVLTSRFGRGAGKTATAQAICAVWGGSIDIAPRGLDWSRVIERLLSPAAAERRCVLIDNAKGRIDAAEVEGAITAPTISGRALYVGEASRPNLLTWFITANSPALSSDLAARAVVIRIGQPKHSVPFRRLVREFLAAHHGELLGDIVERLGTASLSSQWRPDRFFEWQAGVLSRFPNAGELSRIIRERRETTDEESIDVAEVADVLAAWVTQTHGADWRGLIPADKLITILRALWLDVTTHAALWARLGPLVGNGALGHCERVAGGRKAQQLGGRGLLWGR